MKQAIQKIASLSMALIVLFSTFSFTVHKHYCGGELKATSVFLEAEKCEMEKKMAEMTCEKHAMRKKCCEDVVEVIEGQDELKISFNDLDLTQQVLVTSFYYTYINLFEGLEENIVPFCDYSPPLVVKDIHELDEVYLI